MKADIEKTRDYYRNLGPENICDCAYCRNYCARVKAAYPEVAWYLDSLGVDIEKTFETSPLEPDEKGDLEILRLSVCNLGHLPRGLHPPDRRCVPWPIWTPSRSGS